MYLHQVTGEVGGTPVVFAAFPDEDMAVAFAKSYGAQVSDGPVVVDAVLCDDPAAYLDSLVTYGAAKV